MNRRRIRWSQFRRSPRNGFALIGATFFGSGLLPKAPGTWGTLAGIPVWFAANSQQTEVRLTLWLALAVWGVWSARVFDEVNGTQDNQNIVMDEVTGVGITAWTAGANPMNYAVAFLLFRLFDILKPWPVRQVDRWSHRSGSPWLAGFGVMADDWVAGAQALLVMLAAQGLGWLPQ